MITYETAKKLEENGFPQTGKGQLYETEEGRLLLEADFTFQNFGMFKKLPSYSNKPEPKWVRRFYKWQKINHGFWINYFKFKKFLGYKGTNRIGTF